MNQLCCICDENKQTPMVPGQCRYNGPRAHRICDTCWWKKFAIEGTSHQCPGCQKRMPLTSVSRRPFDPVIDLVITIDADLS